MNHFQQVIDVKDKCYSTCEICLHTSCKWLTECVIKLNETEVDQTVRKLKVMMEDPSILSRKRRAKENERVNERRCYFSVRKRTKTKEDKK